MNQRISYRLFRFNSKEFVLTVSRADNIAECSRIGGVSRDEGNLMHLVTIIDSLKQQLSTVIQQ